MSSWLIYSSCLFIRENLAKVWWCRAALRVMQQRQRKIRRLRSLSWAHLWPLSSCLHLMQMCAWWWWRLPSGAAPSWSSTISCKLSLQIYACKQWKQMNKLQMQWWRAQSALPILSFLTFTDNDAVIFIYYRLIRQSELSSTNEQAAKWMRVETTKWAIWKKEARGNNIHWGNH